MSFLKNTLYRDKLNFYLGSYFVHAQLLIHVQLFGTPCTVACQASLSMEFSRQEDWNGLLFPTPEDSPDAEMEPEFLHLLRWQVDSFNTQHFSQKVPINSSYLQVESFKA